MYTMKNRVTFKAFLSKKKGKNKSNFNPSANEERGKSSRQTGYLANENDPCPCNFFSFNLQPIHGLYITLTYFRY